MMSQTIYQTFAESSNRNAGSLAVQLKEDGQWIKLTYQELHQRILLAKALLEERGIKPGDRIALLSENRPEWVIAFFACLSLRTTVIPLDVLSTHEDLVQLIAFSDLRVLVSSDKASKKHASLIDSLSKDLPCWSMHNWELIGSSTPPSNRKNRDPDPSIALIIFTSGKTGTPKGVMLTHQAILHNASAIKEIFKMDSSQRVLSIVPLNHMYGLGTVLLSSLLAGSSVTFIDALNRETIFNTLQQEKITILPAVPRLFESFYQGIAQKIRTQGRWKQLAFNAMEWICSKGNSWFGFKLGKILFKKIHQVFGGKMAFMACGGAPLPESIAKKFDTWGFTLLNGYGMTEFSPVITFNTTTSNRIDTVGRAMVGSEIKIEKGNIFGEGEVCARGTSLMQGYFRNPEATSQAIIEGWLHTGDLGKIDDQGFLTLTGRIKELIVTSSGKKASPDEIEHYYSHIPSVKELAIIGRKSSHQFGEEIAAAVVASHPNPSDEEKDNIRQEIHERSSGVPAHFRVQHIFFLDEIPKTSTLKFKHNKIKELLDTGNAGNQSHKFIQEIRPQDLIDYKLLEAVGEEYPKVMSNSRYKNNMNLSLQYDLGIDSLGRINLVLAIEKKLQIKLDPEKIFSALTLADLSTIVRNHNPQDRPQSNPAQDLPPAKVSALRTPLVGLAQTLSQLLWGLEIQGLENIPLDAQCIFVPNHQTHIDVFWVLASLPKQVRDRIRTFAKKEHFQRLGTRLFAEAAGGIPVDRLGQIHDALARGLKELQNGNSLLIHPEGTRTTSGKLGPFQRGAAHLSIRSQVPLIPVYIEGGTQIFPPQRLLPRLFDWKVLSRYKLKIHFGVPIYPPAGVQTGDAEEKLTAQIRDAVKKLGAT